MIEYKSRERKAPGLKRVYNWLGSTMQTFARELCPYLQAINCGGGGGNGGYANYVEVPISSAQILNMNSVPIQLLPPLPNTQYYKYEIFFEYTPGSLPYTVSEQYVLTGGITYPHASYPDNMLGTNKLVFIGGSQQGQIQLSGLANRPAYNLSELTPQGIRLSNKNSPTGGDGTILAKIWYTVVDFG
jgi:hypothetical protein